MRRREFIAMLGASAVWPLAVGAQQQTRPVIGFLGSGSPDAFEHLVAAFRRGLSEAGFAEGQNIAIEYRWAEGHYERLPALAAELVRQQVAVIIAAGGAPAARAAKNLYANYECFSRIAWLRTSRRARIEIMAIQTCAAKRSAWRSNTVFSRR